MWTYLALCVIHLSIVACVYFHAHWETVETIKLRSVITSSLAAPRPFAQNHTQDWFANHAN